MSCATGNWLTASTWALVDSTSYLNSETGTQGISTTETANRPASGTQPGAITIDGLAVKVAARGAGASGTITIRLWNLTDGIAVTGTLVTVNAVDVSFAASALEGGWCFLKFAAPVTLPAAKTIVLSPVASVSNSVTLFRSATTSDWSKVFRTTTTQAPATGDDLIVAGEHTGAGTGSDITITMDETAATDYGSNTTSTVTPALAICKRGTLKFNDASGANPKLRLSGHAIVYSSGTLSIGTVATPIPRNSTAILEFDCAADGDFGLVCRNNSTSTLQGLSRTSGKNIVACKLMMDASASGAAPSTSSLTVDTDTGWLSGDQIAIAATSQTASNCETGTLNADAGASSIVAKDMTAGAAGTAVPPTSNRGLLVAHSGTSPTQAEIILLTRNVKVRSTSATAMSFVNILSGAVADFDWAEFYYLGDSVTGKRGIEVEFNSVGGAVNYDIQYCSLHDCEDFGFHANAAGGGSITTAIFSHNAMWNLATIAGPGCQFSGAIATGWIVNDNILIRTGNSNGWTLSDVGGTFTNNTVIGATSNGIALSEAAILGVFSGNICHSNTGLGLTITASLSGTITSFTGWRNASFGFGISAFTTVNDLTIDIATLFGNGVTNIDLSFSSNVSFKSLTSSGDTTFTTLVGMRLNAPSVARLTIDNSDFSTVSGIKTAHTNSDILVNQTSDAAVVLRNTKLGATAEIGTPSNLSDRGFIASQKHDQTAGNHKTWLKNGTIQTDAAIYNTAAPSMLMTPISATLKLESAPQFQGLKVAVNNGSTATVSCYTRKSATYNGNQPRLIQKANPALGQDADVVLATLVGGTGSWIQMSGTTSTATDDGAWEIVVDCDGTAGTVNIDDFAVS